MAAVLIFAQSASQRLKYKDMILFFYGPNTYMSRAKVRDTVARFKKSTKSDFGLERIDASDNNCTVERVVAAITSVPFLVQHRLVIIEGMLSNKVLAEAVLTQLKRVPQETVTVFYEAKADERTKIFKELKTKTKSIKFEELEPAKLKAWVIKMAEASGGKIDSKTTQFLLEYAGGNQWKLANEIEKLVNAGPTITNELIKELVAPAFEQSIFDLVEALAKGDARGALKMYQGLRQQKAQPLYVLSMIGWQMRNLLLVKAAGERSSGEIAKSAKISPFVVNKSLALTHRMELETIARNYSEVQQTDAELKLSPLSPDIIMQRLILNIAGDLAG